MGFDFSDMLRSKSDRLNADDLIGGPITVQITGVRRQSSDEQPLVLELSGGHMPWRPGVVMRRLLAALWETTDSDALVGRWVTLYRDPSVRYGRDEVGGVRVSHASHIDRVRKVALNVRRQQQHAFEIRPLKTPAPAGAPTADLDRLLSDEGLTAADLSGWLESRGRRPLDEATPQQRAGLAGWLAADPSRLADVRAWAIGGEE